MPSSAQGTPPLQRRRRRYGKAEGLSGRSNLTDPGFKGGSDRLEGCRVKGKPELGISTGLQILLCPLS